VENSEFLFTKSCIRLAEAGLLWRRLRIKAYRNLQELRCLIIVSLRIERLRHRIVCLAVLGELCLDAGKCAITISYLVGRISGQAYFNQSDSLIARDQVERWFSPGCNGMAGILFRGSRWIRSGDDVTSAALRAPLDPMIRKSTMSAIRCRTLRHMTANTIARWPRMAGGEACCAMAPHALLTVVGDSVRRLIVRIVAGPAPQTSCALDGALTQSQLFGVTDHPKRCFSALRRSILVNREGIFQTLPSLKILKALLRIQYPHHAEQMALLTNAVARCGFET